jgi:hypothetical protein
MKDTAVEEIRQRRRKMIDEKYGGSTSGLVKEAKSREKAHKRRVISLRDRKAVLAK